jgi:hypothetical protein
MLLMPAALQGKDVDRCVAGPPQSVFRAEAGVDTEGLAVAPDGEVLTADMWSGTIYRIRHHGKSEVFATLFSPGEYASVWVLGMTFGRAGPQPLRARELLAAVRKCGNLTGLSTWVG